MESKVRSVAEVLIKFFGATFFLEVDAEIEGAVISVIQGLRQSDRLIDITHGSCALAMGPVRCPGSHRVRLHPSAPSEFG